MKPGDISVFDVRDLVEEESLCLIVAYFALGAFDGDHDVALLLIDGSPRWVRRLSDGEWWTVSDDLLGELSEAYEALRSPHLHHDGRVKP